MLLPEVVSRAMNQTDADEAPRVYEAPQVERLGSVPELTATAYEAIPGSPHYEASAVYSGSH